LRHKHAERIRDRAQLARGSGARFDGAIELGVALIARELGGVREGARRGEHRIIPNAQESVPRLLEVARLHAFSEDVVIGAGAPRKGSGALRAETAPVRAKL